MAIASFHFGAMASNCELRLAMDDQVLADTLAQAAIAEVRRIESKYSRYRADSAQCEGEASGRSAMDEFLGILDQPQAQPMTTPSNDVVREGLKTGISTGTVPPLASYTPPGTQNAGQPNGRPQPSYAPPMADARIE